MIDRVDYAALKVGDTMHLAESYGWSSNRITEYTVVKISPKGQITCRAGASEIRLTPRGSIIGDSSYSRRHFVTAKQAQEIRQEAREQEWFRSIRSFAKKLDDGARLNDMDETIAAFDALSEAIRAKIGQLEEMVK